MATELHSQMPATFDSSKCAGSVHGCQLWASLARFAGGLASFLMSLVAPACLFRLFRKSAARSVPAPRTMASASGGSGGDAKGAAAATPENPALEGLNRAFFLQAAQVRAYRDHRDQDFDDLE
jgi:hypothetical protein